MNRNTFRILACSTLLIATQAKAVPIGLLDQDGGFLDLVMTNITTGSTTFTRAGRFSQDGTDINGYPDLFDEKAYTAQQVQLGNADEVDESYMEDFGYLGKLFSSSIADGSGHMEVGADGRSGASRALSRFNLTVKNHRSRPVNLNFAFEIPAGEIYTNDPARFPHDDPRRAHATLHAHIDALLKSPDEEEPGRWVETDHDLFDFYVDLLGSCAPGDPTCAGLKREYSDNAQPYLSTRAQHPRESIFGFDIAAYSGLIAMPEIPPFGELTLFYDMYALGSGSAENGAYAAFGDPFDLIFGQGVRLIELYNGTPGTPVPEPDTLALAGLGLLAIGWRVRRSSCDQRLENTRTRWR